MTEKEQRLAHLPPQTNPYGRADEEIASVADNERRQKRMKRFLYVAAFVVFQIGVITLFSFTIMKFRNPKFRVRSVAFDNFEVATTTPPSFNIQMTAELGVKNTNFGQFRYRNGTVDFYYRDRKVGEAFVPRAKASWRSTRRFRVTVNLRSENITNTSELATDLSAGVLPITAQSNLRGRVTIMFMMKKNRNANMNCSMNLVTASRELQNLACR